jgi:pilus assembly protein CpaB
VLARRSGETPVVEEPSTGSAPVVEEPSSGSGAALGQDWRTSNADVRPLPPAAAAQPFSFMRGATPIVMAGILLVIAGALVYTLLVTSERAVKRGWNLVPVTVAAVNMPEGTIVDFNMLSQRGVPEQFVTASVIRPDSISYIEHQRIMVPVQAGDPLLWSQFETSKASERLSRKVQKKARAYTIRADSIASVGGWVQPGDHVDLVVSIQDPNKKERNAAIRLQNVIVLATGKITQTTNTGLLGPGQKRYTDVSVLALPEEIEILALMREKASYRMLLRNEEDVDIVEDRLGAAPSTLLNGERVMLLGKKRAATIEMIRGSSPQVPVPRR